MVVFFIHKMRCSDALAKKKDYREVFLASFNDCLNSEKIIKFKSYMFNLILLAAFGFFQNGLC